MYMAIGARFLILILTQMNFAMMRVLMVVNWKTTKRLSHGCHYLNHTRGKHMMNIKPPCGGCADRREACHDSCERYKEYKERIRTATENKHEAMRYTKPNTIPRRIKR